MAKTFNDFMIECAAYPYSQQHFDLLKEASELELTAQFLRSQQYMAENHDMLFGEGVELTAGYLTESADDQTIEVMTEKFEEKASALWGKITNGVRNLLKTLRNLFMRIAPKFDENSKTGASLLEKINSKGGLDQKSAEQVAGILKNHHPSGFEIPTDKQQPFASKIKAGSLDDTLKQQLAVALSTTTVIVKTPGANANTAALDIRDIRNIVSAFKGTIKDESALKGCQAALKSAIDKSLGGLTIAVDKDHLKKCAEEVEKIQNDFEHLSSGKGDSDGIGVQANKAAMNRWKEEREKGISNEHGGISIATGIYSSLTSCMGVTTKMYLGLYNYRNAVVKALKSVVSGGDGKEEPEGKEEPKQEPKGDEGGAEGGES